MIAVDARTRDFAGALLESAGIPGDGSLLVHASFRALAAMGHDPAAVAAAFLDHMARGTLLMPAMSWRIATPANPYFDARSTPSHVGVLAETFRTRFATARSVHPTHSVCAAGRDAAAFTDGHHLDATPCAARSPFAKLAAAGGHVLMLGCGLETCTAFHCAEERWPETYFAPGSEIYDCTDLSGAHHRVSIRRHNKAARDFPKFGPPLLAAGVATAGKAGDAGWFAAPAAALVAAAAGGTLAQGAR